MRFTTIVLGGLAFVMSNSSQCHAQGKGSGAALLAGTVLAAGAVIASIEQLKEGLEGQAMDYLLSENPEMKAVSLSVLDWKGRSLSDFGGVQVVAFSVIQFDQVSRVIKENQVLIMFTSNGWVSASGMDFSKIQWELMGVEQWNSIFAGFVNLASPVPLRQSDLSFPRTKEVRDENSGAIGGAVYQFSDGYDFDYFEADTLDRLSIDKLKWGRRGMLEVETGRTVIPFYFLKGDDYLISDYSEKYRLFVNERALGIYLKQVGRAVQIRRLTVERIHEFINEHE